MKKIADGRAKRWDAHRQARQLVLIESVVAAIEAVGPEISIEQIAEQIGLARPLLYRHFEDRAGLQAAVFSHATTLLLDALAPLWSSGMTAPGTLIVPTLERYFRWVGAHPHLSRYCLNHSAKITVHTLCAMIALRLGEMLFGYFAASGLTQTKAQVLAVGIVGLTEATAIWWLDDPSTMTVEDLADHTGRLVQGILATGLAQIGVVMQVDGTVGVTH